jgi:two-component system LytT family response regulator
MNILIVDDSRLARKELTALLGDCPGHQVIGEAENVQSAVSMTNRLSPALLLLDIHLPDGSGFDVLEQAEYTPKVIFTTAYEQHALRAFEVNALDYLLKPVTAERLSLALAKLELQELPGSPGVRPDNRRAGEHLFIRDGERCHFVKFDDIRLLEVVGNCVQLHFRDAKATLAKSMSYVEERLDRQMFFRCNRQQIVNLNFIISVDPWIGDGFLIKLQDGKVIEVSRRQARALKERLEL